MKYTIFLSLFLFTGALVNANEKSYGSAFTLRPHSSKMIQLSINSKAETNNDNNPFSYKTDCEAVYLAQSALNQLAYDLNRASCISNYGNTTAGINCQTYALQVYSATEIGNYNQFMNCMYPYTLP